MRPVSIYLRRKKKDKEYMPAAREILDKLLEDPDITEIMINGPDKVFVEKGGVKTLTDIKFAGNEDILSMINEIFSKREKRVNENRPYGDVCLEDGSRVNVIIPPSVLQGVAVTIRKFSQNIRSLDDLVKLGSLSRKAADFLIACIKGKLNIIFSGGTGTGKTTTLEMLSYYIPEQERVITIEDTAELKLHHSNLISLETKDPDEQGKGGVSLSDLIRNSLRMRPDRLIIGEVRGAESLDMIQAMSTGHKGTLAAVHGNSPLQVLARLEALILSSGIKLSLPDIRRMIADTINIIVQQEKFDDETRHITYISEVRGTERGEIVLQDLFKFRKKGRDENGKILGYLKPSMRMYPLFFNAFQREGLLDESIFSDDNE